MMPHQSDAQRWRDIELRSYDNTHSGELVSGLEALQAMFQTTIERRENLAKIGEYFRKDAPKILGYDCPRCGIVLGPLRIEAIDGKREALKYRCSLCRENLGERVLKFKD